MTGPLPTQTPDTNAPFAIPAGSGRPRLVAVRFTRAVNSRCRCKVTLEWPDARILHGEAEGVCSPSGELRCAALATVRALGERRSGAAFELVGVKAVRAFDTTVVIASLSFRGAPGATRLVGSAMGRTSVVSGAVRAVLQAANRLVTKP
jgi:hypothetical protein